MLLMIVAAVAVGQPLPSCANNQLSFSFDSAGGTFSGMQKAGLLMVIRNLGPGACSLPALPTLTFLDAKVKMLPVLRQTPPHMHPGPVIVPIGIAEGAEATALVTWVSAPAFDNSKCISARSARVSFGFDSPLVYDGIFVFCSPKGVPATFNQPVLHLDPSLTDPGPYVPA